MADLLKAYAPHFQTYKALFNESFEAAAEKQASAPKLSNWINNVSAAVSAADSLDVTTPITGSVIAQVPISGADEVAQAVNVAHAAFADWSARTYKDRAQYLIRFHQVLTSHADELADIVVVEHGKSKPEALGSVMKGAETLEYAMSMPALAAGRVMQVSRGVMCQDTRTPVGVVASVVPFNFPIMVPLWTLPIALACGNTVVLKPSEKVPLTLTRLMQLLQPIFPPGVINLCHGDKSTAKLLVEHPRVSAVTFVGTSAVADLLTQQCAKLHKRCIALGGAKNHLVALPDCDLDMTAQDIVNSFTGCAGQRCMAASVLLIVGDHAQQQRVLDAVTEKAAQLLPGPGARQMGPVIDTASRDKILRYINEAEQKCGADVLVDGRSHPAFQQPRGHWVGPTVLLHKSKDDPAMREEIFGPVLSVYLCRTAAEALEIENSNPYGNAACVYTSSGTHAEYFTQRFSAGMIGVNIGVPVPREPFSFGGINRSNFAASDITGDGGVEFFTQRRKITTKWAAPKVRTWMD